MITEQRNIKKENVRLVIRHHFQKKLKVNKKMENTPLQKNYRKQYSPAIIADNCDNP
jgi:hypothetical protein